MFSDSPLCFQPPLVIGPSVIRPWLDLWNHRLTSCPYQFVPCEDEPSLYLKTSDHEDLPIAVRLAAADHIRNIDPNGKEGRPVGCYGVRIDFPKERTSSTDKKTHNEEKTDPDSWTFSVESMEGGNPLTKKSDVRNAEIDRYSVVYSGDTRPCDGIVNLAKDCNVLIHEGEFSHNLNNNAPHPI